MDACEGIVASRRWLVTRLWMVLIAAPLFVSTGVLAKEEHRKPVMVWTMSGGGYPGDFSSATEAFAALNQGAAEDYAACIAGQCGVCDKTGLRNAHLLKRAGHQRRSCAPYTNPRHSHLLLAGMPDHRRACSRAYLRSMDRRRH